MERGDRLRITEIKVFRGLVLRGSLFGNVDRIPVVSGRLNIVTELKQTNKIVSFGRSGHSISL